MAAEALCRTVSRLQPYAILCAFFSCCILLLPIGFWTLHLFWWQIMSVTDAWVFYLASHFFFFSTPGHYCARRTDRILHGSYPSFLLVDRLIRTSCLIRACFCTVIRIHTDRSYMFTASHSDSMFDLYTFLHCDPYSHGSVLQVHVCRKPSVQRVWSVYVFTLWSVSPWVGSINIP